MNSQEVRSLLIVDDEPDIREILLALLDELGIELHTAGNGEEALSVINTNPVCAVLSDIKMPVMDGFEFLKQVRAHHVEIPVVMLTAFGDKENVMKALRLGAMDFLEKPVDEREAREVLNRALEIGSRIRRIHTLTQESPNSNDLEKKVIEINREKRMIGLLKAANYARGKKR